MLGFSQLLEMDELPDHQGEAVGHIMRAGRHLLNLIDEVLDIARIESGNLELSSSRWPSARSSATPWTWPVPWPRRAASRSRPTSTAAPGTCHVLSDRQRLLQVMLNLLSNAVKYNRTGGQRGRLGRAPVDGLRSGSP